MTQHLAEYNQHAHKIYTWRQRSARGFVARLSVFSILQRRSGDGTKHQRHRYCILNGCKEQPMKKLMNTLAISAMMAITTPVAVQQAYAASATSQSAEEFRTSKLVGTKVYNAANENIGSIEDIVLKPDGTLQTVVLSVGGFLGMGEKYVSVPFSSLKVMRDNGAIKIMTDGTKDSLKALPDYQFYKS
jgi:sporulation protein YlmC with PRC-barrel domain